MRSSVLCLSVFLFVCLSIMVTTLNSAKTAEPIEMRFRCRVGFMGLRNRVLDGYAHRRHLVTTIELAILGGDASRPYGCYNKLFCCVTAGDGKAPVWSPIMDLTGNELVELTGKTVQMKCPADGHPRPTIRWLKNGRNFTDRPIGKVRRFLYMNIHSLDLDVPSIRLSTVGGRSVHLEQSAGPC